MKRQFFLSPIFLFLLCAFFTLSCEDKTESAELTVEPELLSFPAEGGAMYFNVTSTADWTITTDEPNIWIEPRNGGTGTTKVQVGLSATQSSTQKFCILVVQTRDGSATRNVRVEQAGVLSEGNLLSVSNHSNYIIFGGQAQDLDSLTIVSNGTWAITGPDWLEVSTVGGHYSALSATVPITGSGSMNLLIRTRSEWREEYDNAGNIRVSDAYGSTDDVELPALQLGRRRVHPAQIVPQTDCMATSWKCGVDVVGFYCHISEENHTTGATPDLSKWTYSEPGYINGWTGLKPNTLYYIGTIGMDANGEAFSVHDLGTMTRSEENMALASIANLQYDGTQWTWDVTPDQNTNIYYIWGTSAGLNYDDGLMGWFFFNFLHKSDFGGETIMERNEASQWRLPLESDFQVLTWAVPKGSTELASHISRAVGTRQSTTKSKIPWAAYADKGMPKGQGVRMIEN